MCTRRSVQQSTARRRTEVKLDASTCNLCALDPEPPLTLTPFAGFVLHIDMGRQLGLQRSRFVLLGTIIPATRKDDTVFLLPDGCSIVERQAVDRGARTSGENDWGTEFMPVAEQASNAMVSGRINHISFGDFVSTRWRSAGVRMTLPGRCESEWQKRCKALEARKAEKPAKSAAQA